MNVFESYMKSDFAKSELKKIAEEESRYPKALPRYGAIFKLEKIPEGVHISFYLRAGVIAKTKEGEELRGKEKMFEYLRSNYPDLSDPELHKIIQKIMMEPSTQKYVRKQTGRSPLLVYDTVLNLPQLVEKSGSEIKDFLIRMLHNGVFDPILQTGKEKKEEDIAELASRLQEVEKGEMKFYPPKAKEEGGPVTVEEFLAEVPTAEHRESSSEKKVVIAQGDTTWWYVNQDDMLIEGPFASMDAAMDDQDRKLGVKEIEEEIPITEEELAMAAGFKKYLEKIAAISDKLDTKGETELANNLDKVIKAAADEYKVVMPYDAVKDFHPKGGLPDTRDGHGKPVPGDSRVETIKEQQDVDLAVATKQPTGEQETPVATASCKKCGLTHIAASVKNCPSCDTELK